MLFLPVQCCNSTHDPAFVFVQDILAQIANQLEELLDLLAEKGFAPLKDSYLRSWLHTGQDVRAPLFYGFSSLSLHCSYHTHSAPYFGVLGCSYFPQQS